MKTTLSKILLGICCTASVLTNTGCVEETIPTSVATEDQLSSSAKATEALLWAMPAYINNHATLGNGDIHFDWGYGSIMHIRDVMTEDMAVVSSGYDWYSPWAEQEQLGESYLRPQFIWTYYWKAIQTANNMISVVKPESATDVQKGYLGAAYAFRALYYLEMSQQFEFLKNDKVSSVNVAGNDVAGLTVPIVREGMSEDEVRNNPRVNRQTMAEFILEDLNKAEEYIVNLTTPAKTLPHLDAVYGIKARYYMWLEDYANAKTYARKAIAEANVSPMNEKDCLDTKVGFNNIDKWMWGSAMQKEDDVVKTGIVNWTSWMSNETTFGYSGTEPFIMISSGMYKRISDTDFRKKMWKAPEGTALEGQTKFIDPEFGARLSDYSSVKFRPNEGNMKEHTIGAASAYPIMRVEEMYFIEAEAAAHLNNDEGRTLITNFMQAHRDPTYSTTANGDDLIEEIVFQKRVELWGEGLTFFDVKRLNLSVTRGYEGTNFGDAKRFNTNGRPAWMNFCIVQTEKNNNSALIGFENPDPSGVYTTWVK